MPCFGSEGPNTGWKKHWNGALAASSLADRSINCRSRSCMIMGFVTHTKVSDWTIVPKYMFVAIYSFPQDASPFSKPHHDGPQDPPCCQGGFEILHPIRHAKGHEKFHWSNFVSTSWYGRYRNGQIIPYLYWKLKQPKCSRKRYIRLMTHTSLHY